MNAKALTNMLADVMFTSDLTFEELTDLANHILTECKNQFFVVLSDDKWTVSPR